MCVAILWGCGEVEQLQVAVRPSKKDFVEVVQPLLEQMSCSKEGGCHTAGVGDFKFIEQPDSTQVQANYLSVKGKIDPESPEKSDLTYLLFAGNPNAKHWPTCFAVNSCVKQKLEAWIEDKEGGPRPGDVDCKPAGETCFTARTEE